MEAGGSKSITDGTFHEVLSKSITLDVAVLFYVPGRPISERVKNVFLSYLQRARFLYPFEFALVPVIPSQSSELCILKVPQFRLYRNGKVRTRRFFRDVFELSEILNRWSNLPSQK